YKSSSNSHGLFAKKITDKLAVLKDCSELAENELRLVNILFQFSDNESKALAEFKKAQQIVSEIKCNEAVPLVNNAITLLEKGKQILDTEKSDQQVVSKKNSLETTLKSYTDFLTATTKRIDKADTFYAVAYEQYKQTQYKNALKIVTFALSYNTTKALLELKKVIIHDGDMPNSGRKEGDRHVIKCNGCEYAFRWCPPGTFKMGSSEGELGRNSTYEYPHKVTLSKGFWMLETEVTQKMWIGVMKNNPSYSLGDNLPVEQVTFAMCNDFCKKLDEQLCLTNKNVSLPTEAQWEYACRAGVEGPFGIQPKLEGMGKSVDVSSFNTNLWGLYDMHGNVYEWTRDYMATYPRADFFKDPIVLGGSSRVIRGGSWKSNIFEARSAARKWIAPGDCSNDLGFRVIISE
ncbi:MAG: SUMF1/EgtB/PvdO family nonheme iron enzyme, partial [Fibrobacter sp.]|nr:SUMF1/EgtB/PvdO family nonheme iron enzyme [Fibrobacter sp.]